MNGAFWLVMAYALLPAAGNFVGGLLAEWRKPSQEVVNRALHAATGIILAVIAVEVMPDAISAAPGWVLAIAFVAGGVTYLAVEAAVERWQSGRQGGAGAGAWMVYVAVATDLFADGLLLGAGSAVSAQLGLALALGQVLADVPEGFSVVANFRGKGVPRARRVLISASFVLPVLAGAALAYFTLRGRSEAIQMTALVFVAGLYTLAAVEDMLREAHDSAEDSRTSALSFLGGFALFLVVSTSLA
jgi:ZIP family zinc transporter